MEFLCDVTVIRGRYKSDTIMTVYEWLRVCHDELLAYRFARRFVVVLS